MKRRESITDVGITHGDGSGPSGTVALAARKGGGREDLLVSDCVAISNVDNLHGLSQVRVHLT